MQRPIMVKSKAFINELAAEKYFKKIKKNIDPTIEYFIYETK